MLTKKKYCQNFERKTWKASEIFQVDWNWRYNPLPLNRDNIYQSESLSLSRSLRGAESASNFENKYRDYELLIAFTIKFLTSTTGGCGEALASGSPSRGRPF